MSSDRSSGPPASGHQPQSAPAPIIRPPVGFAYTGPTPFATSSTPAPYIVSTSQHAGDPANAEHSKKKRHKGGEKSKEKSKSRHSDRSQNPPAEQLADQMPHRHQTQMPSFSPSFRIRNYTNEPSPPVPEQYSAPRGQHKAYFSPNEQSGVGEVSNAPRGQYYRHDYDKQRSEASSRESHRRPPPSDQAHARADHRSGAHHDRPEPTQSPASYRHASPPRSNSPPPQPQYHNQPSQYHHPAPQSNYNPQQYARATSSAPTPPPQRPLRVLTLLIEDMRTGESQLAEIKVPLRQAMQPETGFWADAQEVCDILQAGPSRIDGPARVLTMRAKYKQIFLRVSAKGESECAPASLKVTPERTIDVYVEFPLDLTSPSAREAPPPMPYPSHSPLPVAAPQPVVPYPADQLDPRRYDADATSHQPSSGRKRRRADVTMSSTNPQHYHQPDYAEMDQDPPPRHVGPPSPPPPPPSRRPQQYLTAGPSSYDRSRPPGHSADQDSSSSSPSGSSSAENSPEPRAPSLSEVSPHSQAGSMPQFSPPPGPSMPVTQPPAPRPQSNITFLGNTPVEGQSFAAPREQPPKKKSKQTHDMMNVDEVHRRSAATSHTSSPHDSGSHSGGAFTNYTTPATFSIPTAPSPALTSDSRRSSGKGKASHTGPPLVVAAEPPPTELDSAVSKHLRTIFKAEVAWSEFVESRKKILPVFEQMKQLMYVQGKIDRYVGQPVPEGVEGAAGTLMTKAQVVRAFNLPLVYGDECTEVLALSKFYGPNGERRKDPRVKDMYEEKAVITTNTQMRRYLSLLREVHNSWVSDHPQDGFVDATR